MHSTCPVTDADRHYTPLHKRADQIARQEEQDTQAALPLCRLIHGMNPHQWSAGVLAQLAATLNCAVGRSTLPGEVREIAQNYLTDMFADMEILAAQEV